MNLGKGWVDSDMGNNLFHFELLLFVAPVGCVWEKFT